MCKAVFDVGGMTCGACVAAIEGQVNGIKGVNKVSVSLLTNKAEVWYNENLVNPETIKTTIYDSGFDVDLALQTSNSSSILTLPSMKKAEMKSDKADLITFISTLQGVLSASSQINTNKVKVSFDPERTGPRTIIEAIRAKDAKYCDCKLDDDTVSASKMGRIAEEELKESKDIFYLVLKLAIPVMLLAMVLPDMPVFQPVLTFKIFNQLSLGVILTGIFTAPIQFGVGKRFYIGAYKSLSHGSANMDVLIALGTTSSYLYSFVSCIVMLCRPNYNGVTFFETSATLITVVLGGKYLENIAKGKTSAALMSLPKLRPSVALLLDNFKVGSDDHESPISNSNSQTTSIIRSTSNSSSISNSNSNSTSTHNTNRGREIPIELIQLGDYLKVLPGSRIPADGVVVLGATMVDESMLTGESVPVSKENGSPVVAGTLNMSGMIVLKTTRVGSDTTLSQIIKLVEDAQTSKLPIQAFADKICGVFVPIILIISVITWVTWFSLGYFHSFKHNFMPEGMDHFLFAFSFAISVIVIACPCALGLATPTAVVVATGIGLEHGIIIKSGTCLETAHKLTDVIFDKTGTLTTGHVTVHGWKFFLTNDSNSSPSSSSFSSSTPPLTPTPNMTMNEILSFLGSAENCSQHPIAKSIADYIHFKYTDVTFIKPDDAQSIHGKGIICTFGTRKVIVGTPAFAASHCTSITAYPTEYNDVLDEYHKSGESISVVVIDGIVRGCVSVTDTVRNDAKIAVKYLTNLGINCWMLTGDNKFTAESVARKVGIGLKRVFAEKLPSDKADVVKKIQKSHSNAIVAMVGDGINDSPALMQADVGIAIGSGQDIACEAANVILVKNSLFDVITLIDLSKVTFRKIKLNFVWALGYNLLFVPVAAGCFYFPFKIYLDPMYAGIAMAFSSVSVVTSSLMLRYYKPPVLSSPSSS